MLKIFLSEPEWEALQNKNMVDEIKPHHKMIHAKLKNTMILKKK